MRHLSILLAASFALLAPCAAAANEKSVPKEIDKYRAAAAEGTGNAANGKKVFEGQKVKCASCHGVGSSQRKAGPDLLGIADKYNRKQLIEAVLLPRAAVLAGYGTIQIETRAGKVISGIVKNRGPSQVELWVADGKIERVAKKDIQREKSDKASLMPDDLHKLIVQRDFVDLIAYLQQLKNPNLYRQAKLGTPKTIASVKKPIHLEPIHEASIRFVHPVWFEQIPGLPGRHVVVENDSGKIWLLEKADRGMRKSLFVDLKDQIRTGQHMGLMSLAFHPQFAKNRKYYLNHHFKKDGAFGTHIVERKVARDLRKDSGEPSRLVIQIDQWTDLHTGGMVAFGPDGYLYIGTGDGGPQTDPEGHAQNLHLLLGAVLRIDVNRQDKGLAYSIPRSNPYYGHADPKVRQEIWASGLRQAWRFSWDPQTKDLWVGDVGQTRFEEITIVRRGENHGWNVHEGFLPFSDRFKRKGVDFVPPVLALGRNHGASVTAGYVYRGKRSKSYQGVYIFGDFESKRIWGLTQKDRQLRKIREIGKAPDRITSFAMDDDGELFLLGYDKGQIYRLVLDKSEF